MLDPNLTKNIFIIIFDDPEILSCKAVTIFSPYPHESHMFNMHFLYLDFSWPNKLPTGMLNGDVFCWFRRIIWILGTKYEVMIPYTTLMFAIINHLI